MAPDPAPATPSAFLSILPNSTLSIGPPFFPRPEAPVGDNGRQLISSTEFFKFFSKLGEPGASEPRGATAPSEVFPTAAAPGLPVALFIELVYTAEAGVVRAPIAGELYRAAAFI